jgi:hypothetical protein
MASVARAPHPYARSSERGAPYVRVAWWLNRTGARGGVVVEWSYNCCLSRLATCVRLHDRCKQYRSANARTARALCVPAFCLGPCAARQKRLSERWPAGVSGGAHHQRQHADTATSDRAGRNRRTFGSAWHGTAATTGAIFRFNDDQSKVAEEIAVSSSVQGPATSARVSRRDPDATSDPPCRWWRAMAGALPCPFLLCAFVHMLRTGGVCMACMQQGRLFNA